MPLVQFDNQIVLDKFIEIITMEETISKKSSDEASAAKPLDNHPPGDITLGVEP